RQSVWRDHLRQPDGRERWNLRRQDRLSAKRETLLVRTRSSNKRRCTQSLGLQYESVTGHGLQERPGGLLYARFDLSGQQQRDSGVPFVRQPYCQSVLQRNAWPAVQLV